MSWLSKIFSSKNAGVMPGDAAAVEDYKGLRITPDPISEGQVWRIAARIAGEVDGVTRSHHMIRADTLSSREDAVTASVEKAKKMIDEQGMCVLE